MRSLLAVGIGAALLLTAACGPSAPAKTVIVYTPPAAGAPASDGATRSADPTTTVPSSTPKPPDATAADAREAELPHDYCDLPAGARLHGGRYEPGVSQPSAWLADVGPALTDLDGDGAKDAIAAVPCGAGGVSVWPDLILLVGPEGKLKAWTNMRDVVKAAYPALVWDRGTTRSMTATSRGVDISFDAQDGGAGVPTTIRGYFTFKDRKLVFTGDGSDPFASASLTTEGYGPIKVGMTKDQLIAAGYGQAYRAGGQSEYCPGARATDAIQQRGIFFVNNSRGSLQAIGTRSTSVKTRSGATVGMTVDQIKAIYGSNLTVGQSGFQAVETVYILSDGSRSLMFFLDPTQSKVQTIYAVNQTSGGIDHGSDNC